MRSNNLTYKELEKINRIENRAYVYGLLCPLDLKIKYIGMTVDLERRIKYHAKYPNNCNKDWVGFLNSKNEKPLILIIEECTIKNARERELFYIYHYINMGVKLNNSQIKKQKI